MTSRDIARHFYDKTGVKITNHAAFARTAGNAKILLENYTDEQIISVIDYLVQHPPKNGFTSLGFLNYCINEILIKIEVQKIKEEESNIILTQDSDIRDTTAIENNYEKFKKIDKPKIRF